LETTGEILLKAENPQRRRLWWEIDLAQTCVPALKLPSLIAGIWQGPVRVARAQVPQFLSQDWPQLAMAPGVQANQSDDFTFRRRRRVLCSNSEAGSHN
jgi:hypothetical protein